MGQPLPPELASLATMVQHLKYVGGGEWSSSCPQCGEAGHDSRSGPPDRFRIFSANNTGNTKVNVARGWCRQCGYFVTAKQLNHQKLTPEDYRKIQADRIVLLEEENARLRKKLKWLQDQPFWRDWHDRMDDVAREFWHRAGIDDYMIELHQLGYTIDHYSSCGGALTIPFIHKDKIQTLQFRLMVPPSDGDKYRFLKDTKAAWFYPDPDSAIGDVVLVMEGAKKAMVAWLNAGDLTYQGQPVTIIATPSKHIPTMMMDDLKAAKRVILALDPDAFDKTGKGGESAIERNVKAIGYGRTLVVRTVGKIDDMFIRYRLSPDTFKRMVGQASPLPRGT